MDDLNCFHCIPEKRAGWCDFHLGMNHNCQHKGPFTHDIFIDCPNDCKDRVKTKEKKLYRVIPNNEKDNDKALLLETVLNTEIGCDYIINYLIKTMKETE